MNFIKNLDLNIQLIHLANHSNQSEVYIIKNIEKNEMNFEVGLIAVMAFLTGSILALIAIDVKP